MYAFLCVVQSHHIKLRHLDPGLQPLLSLYGHISLLPLFHFTVLFLQSLSSIDINLTLKELRTESFHCMKHVGVVNCRYTKTNQCRQILSILLCSRHWTSTLPFKQARISLASSGVCLLLFVVCWHGVRVRVRSELKAGEQDTQRLCNITCCSTPLVWSITTTSWSLISWTLYIATLKNH